MFEPEGASLNQRSELFAHFTLHILHCKCELQQKLQFTFTTQNPQHIHNHNFQTMFIYLYLSIYLLLYASNFAGLNHEN